MQLGNEVIVKNFHVLESGDSVSAVQKDGKVYFKVTDTNSKDILTTDQFCLESIKRVRLTKPTSCVFKKWEVTIPASLPAAGTLLTVYMHFTNLNGYGITDRWEKFATVAVTSTVNTCKKVAQALAAQINAQYIQGMKPVTASATGTSDASTDWKVVITDNTYSMQTPTRRRLEMHMDPQPIQMYITTNILEGDDTSWASEVSTQAAAGKKYEGVPNSSQSYKNDYLIWCLEKVSQLNSTENMTDPCSGFIGYDSVLDNAALNSKTYWVLDIAYETLPKMGVPSGRNLKEVSFAAAVADESSADTIPTVLTNALNAIGRTINSNGDTVPAYGHLTVTAGSHGSVTGGGSYLLGSQVTLKATAASGYHFDKWTINGTADTTELPAEIVITVTGDATYVASFAVNA